MPVLLQTMRNGGLGADVGNRDVRGLLFLHVMTSDMLWLTMHYHHHTFTTKLNQVIEIIELLIISN